MDGLFALGVLLVIALPVMAIAGFIMGLTARGRISALERKVVQLEARLAGAPLAEPGAEAAAPSEPPPETAPPAVEEEPFPAWRRPARAESPAEEPPAETPQETPAEMPLPAAARASLEERLGTRWTVWVGGLALALGAIFLVRYSIEAGLLGPGVRLAFGALFSLALLAGGEWLRRNELQRGLGVLPAASIPGVLTAAGTAGLFATVYAAHGLYGLIGSGTAFALLGAIGVGTLFAAALHGAWLSALGLVASYVTPFLVTSDQPNMPPLLAYLIAVTAAAYALARLRHWRWVAIAASVAAILWGLFLTVVDALGPVEASLYMLALFVLAAFFLVVDVHRDGAEAPAEAEGEAPTARFPFDPLASLVLAGLAALAVFANISTGFDPVGIAAALAMGLGLLAIAQRYDAVSLAAPIAAVLLVVLLYFWPAAYQAASEPVTYVHGPIAAWFPLPDAIASFLSVATFGALVLVGASWRRLTTAPLPGPAATIAHAAAANAGPVLVTIVAWLRVDGFVASPVFALAALVLAGLFAAIAERFVRREAEDARAGASVAVFATGAIAALAAGLTIALEGGTLTSAFAASALGAAWVQVKRPIAALRWAAAALALLVLGRIAWDPYIFGVRQGAGVYLSILAGYGIPAAAFALAASLLRRIRTDRPLYAVEALAVITTALLVVFQIRAIVFGGDLLAATTTLAEQGLTTTAAFAFSLGLARLASARPSPVFAAGAIVARVIALLNAGVALGVAANPFLTGEPVAGGIVFNEILLAYALPAALAALSAIAARRRVGRSDIRIMLDRATAMVALLLAFGAITLEIRFLFGGPALDLTPIEAAESWTYSVAWLALGIALLLAGLVFNLTAARVASALLILVTVLKVFLIDMANLEGVWRALSFIALGAVLIGIGLLYQRLLFARRGAEPPAAEEPAAGE